MPKKITKTALKNLVLETVREINSSRSSKSPKVQRSREFAAILENAKIMMEKADPSEFDSSRFPSKLSVVAKDPDKAEQLSKDGLKDGDIDGDKIPYTDKKSIASCKVLKPSQSSMNIKKALAFALGHIKSGKPGGHLGAFVSSDGFIMDGHHRWISSGMVDPNSSIGGYEVDFPGEELVAILNNLTVGRFDVLKGKKATGGFDQFKEGPIRKQLEDYLANGSGAAKNDDGEPNPYRMEPEEIQELIEKFTGVSGDEAKEAAVKKFTENLSELTMSVPSWAMERPDMPVIEKSDSAEARKALEDGEIDVNPPYANESLDLQRWNKLAGLLKD